MKVSIVVCILDGSRYIKRIVDYIGSQTYKDIETIFVISSESTDDSLELTRKYSVSLPGSVIIEYLDVGRLGGSKNCGLERVTGDCVWFLDVDDSPSEHYLEYLTRIMEAHGADVVACNYVYSGRDERPSEMALSEGLVETMTSEAALGRRLTERFPVASWSMIYRTETIRRNGISFKEGMCEDIDFTVSMLEHSKVVAYYKDVLYAYRIHDDSFTASHSDERGLREVDIYSEMAGSCKDGFMRDRMVLTMLRSMGHMSLPTFVSVLYGDKVRETVIRHGMLHSKFEYSFMKVLPLCYYAMITLFFKGYFYKSGRTFTRRPRRHGKDDRCRRPDSNR